MLRIFDKIASVQQRALSTTSHNSSMLDYFRRKKEAPVEEDDSQVFSLEEEVKVLTEEEIDAKRNKSRLRDYHQRLVNGELPHPEPKFWTHHTVAYKRKMFGRYGVASGVNPGILWPTREELMKKIKYEDICNPFTIQEMVADKRKHKAMEQEEFERREKEVDERMKLVDKFKAELLAKQAEKEKQQRQATQKREKLMEEVRRHFGYTVDPKDEKFQELLAKKEKEQRKTMKEARKLEKQQKALDRIEGKTKEQDKQKKIDVEDND